MIVRGNETTVQAKVNRIVPCGDGYGHDVELEILGNESADAGADFLKPKPGDRLQVFAADLGDLETGVRIRAALGLSGGPFGQRTVLRDAVRTSVKS